MLCIKISMLMIISMISLEVIKIKDKGRKDIDEGNYLFGVVLFTIFYSLFHLLLQSNIFIKLNINFLYTFSSVTIST